MEGRQAGRFIIWTLKQCDQKRKDILQAVIVQNKNMNTIKTKNK